MTPLVIIAAIWLLGIPALLVTVCWLGEAYSRRQEAKRVNPRSQERLADVLMFPRAGRRVMGVTQKPPAPLATTRGLTHRGEVDAHH